MVIQPTPFCNIDCGYCYLPNRTVRDVMSAQTIEKVAQEVFASGWVQHETTFVWHAGEPMVLPISYYRDAFAIIERYRPPHVNVVHSFQTNGTLVTDEWCDYIKEADLKIGVSLDGPQDLHDKFRKTRSGKGSFDRVMKGVERLRSHGVDFSIICVLTKDSLANTDRIFDFFEDLGVSRVSFNVEEAEGEHKASSLDHTGVEKSFREFMARFWARSFKSKTIKVVREIEEMMTCVVRPEGSEVRNTQTEPFAMLNIDCKGNFTTFSPELLGLKNEQYGDYIIGNLHSVSLKDSLHSSALLKMRHDIDLGVEQCRNSCEYFTVCGGGSPVNKMAENGSFNSTETNFCRLKTKAVCDLSMNLLEALH